MFIIILFLLFSLIHLFSPLLLYRLLTFPFTFLPIRFPFPLQVLCFPRVAIFSSITKLFAYTTLALTKESTIPSLVVMHTAVTTAFSILDTTTERWLRPDFMDGL